MKKERKNRSAFIAKLFPKRREKTESTYFSPEKRMGKASVIVGTALRGLTVFIGLFGLMHLFYQACGLLGGESDFRFYSLSAGFILFVCFAVSAIVSFIPFNRFTKLFLPLGSLGLTVLFASISSGNPVLLFENAVRRLYNAFMYGGVYRSGYSGMGSYIASESYSFPEKMLIEWGVVLFAAVFGVLFYFSVIKKTRLWLYVITLALVVVPVLTFNISKGNLGFAFIIASVAGFISMRIVDYRYGGRLEKRLEKRKQRKARAEEKKIKKEAEKIADLKLKAAAEKVYDAAIKAEMGSRRARRAKNAVLKRARAEKKRIEKLALKNEKALKKEKKNEEKKNREKAETELTNEERRALKLEQKNIKLLSKRNVRAASGYAGIAAITVTLLAALIPFALATKPFSRIGFIDDRVKTIRRDVTDFLIGDGVDLNGELYSESENFNFETITFDKRVYENKQIFKVEAPRITNVFLKSRTALDYDISSDTWCYADSDGIIEMNRSFGKGFTSDTITVNALSYLYPSSVNLPPERQYGTFGNYGFITEQIRVRRVAGASGLLFMPSIVNTRAGLFEFDSREAAKGRYTAFFDGIYTSRHYSDNTEGYSAVSFVYEMAIGDMGDVIACGQDALESTYSLAKRASAGESAEELLRENKESTEWYARDIDLCDRYFGTMSESERENFLKDMELEKKYREYVGKAYTKTAKSDIITEIADSICENAEKEKGRELTDYEKVMATVKYLDGDEFTYSLEPTVPEEMTFGVIETFLSDTKCGYCSHYATAAALILREYGIPVRYAEGYAISKSEWFSAYGKGSADKLRCNVYDKNSHTWIEVYFDGIGWIPFEVTKSFIDEELYTPKDEHEAEAPDETDETDDEKVPIRPDDSTVEITVPEREEKPKVKPAEIWSGFKILVVCVVSALILFAVYKTVVLIFKKKADASVRKRYQMIGEAKDEKRFSEKREDNRALTRAVIDSLFEIFKAVGIGPEKGELLTEFGTRLAKEYSGLSTNDPEEVMKFILKEEFGHGLSYKELSTVAEYLEDAIGSVYSGLGTKEKIRLRYIKHII